MNLSQVRTEVRRLMAETTAASSYCSDTDVDQFINDGIKDACIKAGILEITKTTVVSNGVASILLPSNFIRAVGLSNQNGVKLDEYDPALLGRCYLITGKPLYYDISTVAAPITTRQAETLYILNELVVPSVLNGYVYECTTAGTTGVGALVFGTTLGSTTDDGTVKWTCRELFTRQYLMTLYDTPTTAGAGTGTYTLTYKAMDYALHVDTDSPNFPEEFHRYLIPYAMYKWAIRARDAQLAQAMYQEYAAGVGIAMPVVEGENAT